MPIAARLAQVAEYVEVANRVGGADAAKELATERRGEQFDPQLADVIVADGEIILSDLETIGTWEAVIEAEPALAVVLSGERLDAALTAIANFVDLKSPYVLGHARAVAELAGAAGAQLGLTVGEQRELRRAGLVHDLGRLGVSNAIWDKPGPLGAAEWERVRMHAVSDRAHAATVRVPRSAGRDRDPAQRVPRRIRLSARPLRALDLPRGLRARSRQRVPGDARAPAAPHRALSRSGRRRAARRRQGRPARSEAVEAVLGAAGHRVMRRPEGPAGLTPREVEVLKLVARGLSNKEVAERLVIAPKTVGNHVEHIYAKIDASNRASASLFAMQHGLLPEEQFPGHQAA